MPKILFLIPKAARYTGNAAPLMPKILFPIPKSARYTGNAAPSRKIYE
jgi:hypothetical protein